MRNKIAKNIKKLVSVQEVNATRNHKLINQDKIMKRVWNGLTRTQRAERTLRAGLQK